ncbi:MAG: selenium cofactor biosynthesis protein YqeC, partial [Actinomycetota bacterium]
MDSVEVIPITGLARALDLGDHELVSLVGGGGKTTALFALGRQLSGPVILTTTTKMGRDRTGGVPLLIGPDDDAARADALIRHRVILVWRSGDADKALGVDPAQCDRWFAEGSQVVVEADGSRRKPFKAPRPYEPVVPGQTTVLVACVG